MDRCLSLSDPPDKPARLRVSYEPGSLVEIVDAYVTSRAPTAQETEVEAKFVLTRAEGLWLRDALTEVLGPARADAVADALTEADLAEIAARAEEARRAQVSDVTVTPEVGATRHAIVMGILRDAVGWLDDPARPLVVTRLGRWAIRVSPSIDDATAEGVEIVGALRCMREAIADVSRLVAEVRRLRTCLAEAVAMRAGGNGC